MSGFRAQSSRGAVFVWRQSETEAVDTGTAFQNRRFEIRARSRVFAFVRRPASGGATVAVPAGTVTYTGFAPTVSTSTAISVPPGTITYTGFAPTVSAGSSAIITIPSGAFTLKGYAPTVSTSNPVSLGSKLDEFPSLPSDSAGLNRKLVDLFRYTNSRVNGLSEGRIFDHYNARTSQPASTEGAQGDFITNARPEELGSSSSKYVVIGWIRLASDWVQCRVLTGN